MDRTIDFPNDFREYVADKDTLKYISKDLVIMDKVHLAPKTKSAKSQHNIIVVCIEGRIMVDINGETVMMNKRDVVMVPPGAIIDNYLISPDFECKMFCLSNSILQSILHSDMNIWTRALYINKMKRVTISDYDEQLFDLYYQLVIKKLNDPKEPFKHEIVETIIKGIIYEICGDILGIEAPVKQESNPYRKYRTSEKLFNDFLELLGSTEVKKHPVRWYASQLLVSPKYLATVCKEQSGKNPLDWIQEGVQEDIRHCLCDTGMPLKEVSDRLGFPNTSFFGKYIREHFGCTPLELRNNVKDR